MRPSVLKEIVYLGVPIAITITAEAGLFNAVSILMGTLGPEITAAHQIAINFASTMFMVPLALNSAITIRVGHSLGRGDLEYARFAGGFGIFVCALFMACSATFLLLFRDVVVSMYTQDTAVKGIAISLLLMAAIFQVAEQAAAQLHLGRVRCRVIGGGHHADLALRADLRRSGQGVQPGKGTVTLVPPLMGTVT
jgi:MATE family multidrug resistance protein